MTRRLAALVALLPALLLAAPAASARTACEVVRDPALYARTPVAAAPAGQLAVGTLNAYRLFDDERDGRESLVLSTRDFRARVARIARYIADDMGAPAIVALQEIEDTTALAALAEALGHETGRRYRYLLGDVAGDGDIRNALLFDAGFRLVGVQSLFDRSPRAGLPLHDRLPLVVDLDTGAHGRLVVVVVHMKSMRGLDSPRDGERVAAKRVFQARELADWVRGQAKQGRRLVVLGDFNAPRTDRGDTRGEPLRILLEDGGLVDRAPSFLQPSQRWTYFYRQGCLLQQLDHVLASPALAPAISHYAIARGDTCVRAREKCDPARSVSDHEGVVVRLRTR